MRREVASSCARGTSDRSMPRTHGEILFVSSKGEPVYTGWRLTPLRSGNQVSTGTRNQLRRCLDWQCERGRRER